MIKVSTPIMAALAATLTWTVPPAVAADALRPLVLQLGWDHQFQFAGYYVAEWEGYFAAEGLKIEPRSRLGPDRKLLSVTDEVDAGRADIGIDSAGILLAREKGADLVVLASIFQRDPLVFLSRRDRNIRGLSDLRGATLAYPRGTTAEASLAAMLRAEGLAFISPAAGVNPLGVRTLLRGEADVVADYLLAGPWIAAKAGLDVAAIAPVTYGVDFYGDSLFAHRRLVDRDPKVVAGFLRAVRKGWERALLNPDATADRIVRELPRVLPLDDALAFNRWQADRVRDVMVFPIVEIGHTNPARWRNMHEMFRAIGLTTGGFDPEAVIFDPERSARERNALIRTTMFWSSLAIAAALLAAVVWIVVLRRVVARRTAALLSADGALRQSEKRYARVVRGSTDGAWEWTATTGENYLSPRWKEILGYADHELPNIEATFFDNIHPDDRETVERAFRGHLEAKMPYDVDLRMRQKNGDYRWVRSRGEAERDPSGRPIRMAGTITDIHAAKVTAFDLAAATENFKKAFYSDPSMKSITDVETGKVVDVNESWLTALGFTRIEAVGRSHAELGILVDIAIDKLRVSSDLDAAIDRKPSPRQIRTRDGRILDVINQLESLTIDGRKVILSVSIDVSAQRRAQAEVQANQDRLALVFNATNDIITLHRVAADGRFVYEAVNSAYTEMIKSDFGAENPTMVGVDRRVFLGSLGFAPATIEQVEERFREAIRGRVPLTYVAEHPSRSSPRPRILENTIYPVFDDASVCTNLLVVGHDITEQREIEKELKNANQRFSTLFYASPVMNTINDIETGALIEVNDRWLQTMGLEREEAIGRRRSELGIKQTVDGAAVRAGLREGKTISPQIETDITTPDGRQFHAISHTATIELGGRQVAMSVSFDVSERHRAEQVQAAALAEKEVLLREIHHRVKNNLQIVSSLLHFQSSKIDDPAQLAIFREGEDRLRSIILVHEKLYSTGDLSHIEFSGYIRDLLTQLQASYRSAAQRIRVDNEGDAVLMPIETAMPCGMIVNELVTNIYKYAFPEDATGIGTVRVERQPGQMRLIVSDNGVGFPPDLDPDKPRSFGLRLIGSLVDQLAGTLRWEPGQGTRVTIEIPLPAPTGVLGPQPPPAPEP